MLPFLKPRQVASTIIETAGRPQDQAKETETADDPVLNQHMDDLMSGFAMKDSARARKAIFELVSHLTRKK